jgi:hypothetical protein
MQESFYLFFHIYADGNFIIESLNDFIPVFKKIKPIKLFIGIVGNQDNRTKIKNILNSENIIYEICDEQENGWEQVTINKIYEFSLNNDSKFFYCHTKGSGNFDEINIYWRRAMLQYNLEDISNILNLLNVYQAVGCYLKIKWQCLCQKNHIDHTFFGGNFWWSSLAIIRELGLPEMDHRHCAEHYLGEILKQNLNYNFYDLRSGREIGENREIFEQWNFKMKEKRKLVDIQNERQFDTDKNSGHSYLETYDNLFNELNEPSILEIGVWTGGSIKLWKEYTKNVVNGIDINPQTDDPCVIKADVKNWIPSQVYDVIIDDGSHFIDDMLIAYDRLQNYFTKYYIIEDIQNEDQLNQLKTLNPWKIFDLRDQKQRYDDILVVFKK